MLFLAACGSFIYRKQANRETPLTCRKEGTVIPLQGTVQPQNGRWTSARSTLLTEIPQGAYHIFPEIATDILCIFGYRMGMRSVDR